MRTAIENLPNDIEALRRLVIEQRALLEQHEAQIAVRDAAVAQRDARLQERETALQVREAEALHPRTRIEKLKLEIARLRRMQFGPSSEKLGERVEQLELRGAV